ncbi:MAG: stage III sporulation protein AF [Eubacteriales bacterium]|nr:stage III sporulation protein AF [Eubacteriales bacterium]
MEGLLKAIRETAVFLLAAQMLLHFLPGKKYEKYGKLIVAVALLAQLALPVLQFGREDALQEFRENVSALEAQNEMFSQKLEGLYGTEEQVAQSSLVQSVEEQVERPASKAGVEVENVRLREDGVVVIEVRRRTAKAAAGAGPAGAARPVEPVEIDVSEPDAVAADGSALRGSLRADLRAAFAEALGMEEAQVEVMEVE